MARQLRSYVATRLRGYAATWLRGYVATQLCGFGSWIKALVSARGLKNKVYSCVERFVAASAPLSERSMKLKEN